MIPVPRTALDAQLSARLDVLTSRLAAGSAGVAGARKAWRSARSERDTLRSHLIDMAPGIRRCMYCGDSLGTDIDHFQPIATNTARTFDWLNHLLACSHCNSNEKRDQFPLDPEGNVLLIDPTRDDPDQHLRLLLSSGEYRPLTPMGTTSIEVYGLNRIDLILGRSNAFHARRLTLCGAHSQLRRGHLDEATLGLRALIQEPYASVLYAMLQLLDSPGATDILGEDVVAALRDPAVLGVLRPLANTPRLLLVPVSGHERGQNRADPSVRGDAAEKETSARDVWGDDWLGSRRGQTQPETNVLAKMNYSADSS